MKPNKDDRRDNVEKLQTMRKNAKENIEMAEETLLNEELTAAQQEQIIEKNERRRKSIEGFTEEIAEEQQARESGYRQK